MRQVTKQVVSAFISQGTGIFNNTTVETSDGVTEMKLFNNPIARLQDGILTVSFAGWPSVTTKERLNGLCEVINNERPFHTVKGQLMQDNKPLDINEWHHVKMKLDIA